MTNNTQVSAHYGLNQKLVHTGFTLVRRSLSKARFALMLSVVVHLIGGFVVGRLEGWTFWEGQWWAAVTGTTTGYGDLYPETFWGRVLAVMFMVVTFFLNAIILAHIVSVVIENKNLFTHTEQEQHTGMLMLICKFFGLIPKNAAEVPPVSYFQEKGLRLEADDNQES